MKLGYLIYTHAATHTHNVQLRHNTFTFQDTSNQDSPAQEPQPDEDEESQHNLVINISIPAFSDGIPNFWSFQTSGL